MIVVAVDTETHLIRRPIAAPRMVCTSWDYGDDAGPQIELAADSIPRWFEWLRDRDRLIVGHNFAYDACVAMAYEPDLIRPIFDAYEDNRIQDTLLNFKLIDIAHGELKFRKQKGYALDVCAARAKLPQVFKDDPWRLKYGDLDGLPLRLWPTGALEYAKNDPTATRGVWRYQQTLCERWAKDHGGSPILGSQAPRRAFYDLALYLAKTWGVRTDGQRVAELRKGTEERMYELWKHGWTDVKGVHHAPLESTGLIKPCGGKRMGAAAERLAKAYAAKGLPVPLTKAESERRAEAKLPNPTHCDFAALPKREVKPKSKSKKALAEYADWVAAWGPNLEPDWSIVSTDRDACILSGDEQLIEWSDYGRTKLLLPRLDDLAKGVDLPLQPRYDSLLESGRTSSSKGEKRVKADRKPWDLVGVQIQNFPRSPDPELARVLMALYGRVSDARSCIKPRDGNGFGLADYSSGELHTLAQVCKDLFGYSKLGDMLNAGVDVHLWFGALAYGKGVTYDEAKARLKAGDKEVKAWRQSAKPIVFGRPGGMGAKKMVVTARKSYGVRFTLIEAKRLMDLYDTEFREVAELFQHVGAMENPITLQQLRSWRWRGGCTYPAACNTYFQGLLADGMLEALACVQVECYSRSESPLYGYRVVVEAHDELVIEGPLEGLAEATERLSEIMERELNKFTPDYPTPAEPVITMLWSKDAGTRRDEEGRLKLWTATKKAA